MGFLDEPYSPQVNVAPTAPTGNKQPYSNLTPKLQNEQMAKDAEEFRKRQGIINTALQNYNNLLPKFKQFSDLNKKVPTGGLGLKLENSIWGLDTLMSPEEQTMISIQNQLTPLQRPAGSGATSNFEEQMYLKSVPNIGMKGNANKAITQEAYDKYYNILGYNKYMNDYFKQYGNLHGVDEKWGQYKDAYINQVKKDNPQYDELTSSPVPPASNKQPQTKGQKTGAILSENIPAGVTKAEWDAMSPQDKALWAK